MGIVVIFHLLYLVPPSGGISGRHGSGLNFLEKLCVYEQLVYIFVKEVTLISCDFVKFCCAFSHMEPT